MKTTRDHLMPRSRICIWTCPPCGLFHFCMGMDSSVGGNGLAREWTCPHRQLAASCWPTAIVSGLWAAIVVQLATGEPILARDRQGRHRDNGTDKVKT